MKIHIVKKGDTLYELAQKNNVELDKLIAMNPQIEDPNQIEIGMKVKIPSQTVPEPPADHILSKHIVVQGDTLWLLSKKWGIPLQTLIQANPQLKNPNVLMTGDIVYIPKTGETAPHEMHKANTMPMPKANTAPMEKANTAPMQKANTAPMPMPMEKANTAPMQKANTAPMPPVEEANENLFIQYEVPAVDVQANLKTQNINYSPPAQWEINYMPQVYNVQPPMPQPVPQPIVQPVAQLPVQQPINCPPMQMPAYVQMKEEPCGCESTQAFDPMGTYVAPQSGIPYYQGEPMNLGSNEMNAPMNYYHPMQNYPMQNYPMQNYPMQGYPMQNYPMQDYSAQNSSMNYGMPSTSPHGQQMVLADQEIISFDAKGTQLEDEDQVVLAQSPTHATHRNPTKSSAKATISSLSKVRKNKVRKPIRKTHAPWKNI